MRTYVSKPVEIQAVQFEVKDEEIGGTFSLADDPAAVWPIEINAEDGSPVLAIQTRSGVQRCTNGDYIIRELDGNGYYPCSASVFEAKYEEPRQSTAAKAVTFNGQPNSAITHGGRY